MPGLLILPLALFCLVIALIWIEIHIPGLLKTLMLAGILWWLFTRIAYP